jgi:hypothetical protein
VIYDAAQYEALEDCARPTGYDFTLKWDSVAVTSSNLGCAVDHTLEAAAGMRGVLSSVKSQLFVLPSLHRVVPVGRSMEISFSEPALDSLLVTSQITLPPLVNVNRMVAAKAYAYPFNHVARGQHVTAHEDLGGGATCDMRLYYTHSKVPRYGGA